MTALLALTTEQEEKQPCSAGWIRNACCTKVSRAAGLLHAGGHL